MAERRKENILWKRPRSTDLRSGNREYRERRKYDRRATSTYVVSTIKRRARSRYAPMRRTDDVSEEANSPA